MTDSAQFTATYKHYQMTASRFTKELDRLTDQADIIQRKAENTSQSVQKLISIATHIEEEVEKARITWGNNSPLVEATAQAAQNAATSAVQQTTNLMVSRINAAVSDANQAVTALRKTQRSTRLYLVTLTLAFLAGSGATYAVARFGFDIGTEHEAYKNDHYQSRLLSSYWKHATLKQKQDFQRVVEGNP